MSSTLKKRSDAIDKVNARWGIGYGSNNIGKQNSNSASSSNSNSNSKKKNNSYSQMDAIDKVNARWGIDFSSGGNNSDESVTKKQSEIRPYSEDTSTEKTELPKFGEEMQKKQSVLKNLSEYKRPLFGSSVEVNKYRPSVSDLIVNKGSVKKPGREEFEYLYKDYMTKDELDVLHQMDDADFKRLSSAVDKRITEAYNDMDKVRRMQAVTDDDVRPILQANGIPETVYGNGFLSRDEWDNLSDDEKQHKAYGLYVDEWLGEYYDLQGKVAEAGERRRENTDSGASGWDIAGDAIMSGLGTFNKGLFATLDWLLPTEYLPGKDLISDLNDYYSGQDDYYKSKLAEDLRGKSKTTKFLAQLGEGTVAAAPNAILALMTGGTSLGASGATLTGQGLSAMSNAQMLSTATQEMLKNPQFWTSFAQMAGTDYEEAKANGASELEATLSAFTKGFMNSAIEVGGGVDLLPKKLQEEEGKAFAKWLISSLEEGIEEPVQSVVSGSVDKAIYDHDKEIFSMDDENAIINPGRLIEEAVMGTGVGMGLGGLQTGGIKTANYIANRGAKQQPVSDIELEGILERVAQEKLERENKTVTEDIPTPTKAVETTEQGIKTGDEFYFPEEKRTYKVIDKGEKNTTFEVTSESGTITKKMSNNLVEKHFTDDKRVGRTAEVASVTETAPTSLKGKAITAETLNEMSKNNEAVSAEDVKSVTRFGDAGAKVVTDLANTEGVTFKRAKNIVQTAYLAGYTNQTDIEANLKTSAEKSAYNAGMKDRSADDSVVAKNSKKVTTYNTGFAENEHSKKLNNAERRMFSFLASDLKMDVSMIDEIIASYVDGNPQYANASHTDGKLKVALNSDNDVFEDAMHESGHRMAEFDTDAWNTLMNALYAQTEELGGRSSLGMNHDMKFDSTKTEHDDAGIHLGTRDIIEEIGVQQLGSIFRSPEAFNKWRKTLNTNPQVKSAWKSFLKWMRNVIENIKRRLSMVGMSKAEKAEARKALAEADRMLKLFEDAYVASMQSAEARANEAAFEAGKANVPRENVTLATKAQEDAYNKGRLEHIKNLKNKPVANEKVEVEKDVAEQPKKAQQEQKQSYTQSDGDVSESKTNFSLKNKNLNINSRIPYTEIQNYIKVGKNDAVALGMLETKVRNIPKGTYQNDATGYRADINADTIRKAIHPTHKNFDVYSNRHIRNLNAMVKLPELFKNAVYVDSKPPQKAKNMSVKEYHHFVAPLFMNNGEYRALITARANVNSDTLYVLRVEVLPTQKKAHSLGNTANAGGSQWVSVPSDISIPELVKDVKIKNYDTGIVDTYSGKDIKFSLKDSKGRILTEAQQEYFKDSKVRDENGNLLVVYHGTRKADFTEFKRNINYFTDSEEMADSYSPNGEKYEGYLNITNPYEIDAKGEKWSKVPIDETTKQFLQNYGAGVFKEGGKWRTTPADIASAIEEAVDSGDLDYDGIIIKNIDDTGSYYKGKGEHLATDYISFKSSQFKNADNAKPTNNPDIRYSLKKDQDYIKAVENGDTETAQKMVDEAAEKAFANSKVRGDDGKLKLVYHGRVSDFNVFDRSFANIEGDFGKGYYFTSNEYDVDANYANEEGPDLKNKISRYAEQLEFDEEYSDLSDEEREEIARQKFITSEPNTITAYLNMENPVYITPDEKGTFLDFNEAYDEEYDEYGEPEGLFVDFVEALKDNASDYAYNDVNFDFLWEHVYDESGMYASDAVKIIKNNILDELTDDNGDIAINEVIRLAFEEIGFDGIIDTSVYYKFNNMNGMDSGTTHYIVFDSEQIKSADIATYDDKGNVIPISERFNKQSKDIRFSLKKSVEETKDLVAVHNVWENKLREALELGGLPSPSIAITKKDFSHDNFGDISLVFRKETISPTDRRNKVYGGDAYTPTRQVIDYKISDKTLEKIENRVKSLIDRDTIKEFSLFFDSGNVENEIRRADGNFVEAYKRNEALKIAFLKDKGIPFKKAMKVKTLSRYGDNIAMRKIARAIGEDTLKKASQDKNLALAQEPMVRKLLNDRLEELGMPRAYDEKLSTMDLYDIFDAAIAYIRQGETKTIDYNATSDRLDKKFTKKLTAEYENWLSELGKDIIEKKGIRNDKDLFTPSGNRRSFEALHWDYTLENIVRSMNRKQDKGFAAWGGNVFGASTKEYGSIAEIKADSSRLQEMADDEYEALKSEYKERLDEIAESYANGKSFFDAEDTLIEAIATKKTKQGIRSYLAQYDYVYKVTDDIVNDLWELRNKIAEMPVSYFEAKPQRTVGFNEVAAAIIPRTKDKSLKTELEGRGVKVLEYDRSKDGDRLKKINSVQDVKFSLKKSNNTSTQDTKELLETIEHLKHEFEVTKFAKADPKKLEKMTREILKDYDSKADLDETFKAVDELYKYMANGEDGNPAAWNDVYDRAYNIARDIVDSATVVDDEMYREYKSLRDYLRKTPMRFIPIFDSVPTSYETFNDFRKHNMGRLKFTNDGMSIDSVYQELASLYPEFFDAEEQTDSADMLARIEEVLDEIQPLEVNPYDSQIGQVASYLANDLTSRFFDIPQAKPTFADKAERRVVKEKIKSNKKLEQARQQRDERIKKLIEKQKEKTKKQLDKVRQQRDVKVAKEKEKRNELRKKISESQNAKELRGKIIRHVADLSKTLRKATDKKHIPPELENAVTALLYNINLESNYTYDAETDSYKKNDKGLPTNKTQAFLALKEVYAQIAKNNDYNLSLAPELIGASEEGIGNLFDEVMKLSDKKIADMTSKELTTIYDAMRIIEHSIAVANKAFAVQKWATFNEMGKAFDDSTKTRRPIHPKMKTQLFIDIKTPLTYFSELGEAGIELYNTLRSAQDQEQVMTDELAELVSGIVSLEQVNKANKDVYEFTTAEGKKLTLSQAHIMNIYLLNNREQGKKHLLFDPENGYTGRGIHQPEVKGIRRGSEPTRLTKSDLDNILSKLDKEHKEIADKLQKATLKLAEWGNKACKEVFGYEKFKDADYWTIKSASESIHEDTDKKVDRPRSIKNIGSGKPTNELANNAVNIDGVFDVFAKHASEMISYSAWLAPMEDMSRLYNFTFRDESGNPTDRRFRGMLDKYLGVGGAKYYSNLMDDIQNGIGKTPDTNFEKWYTKIYGAAAKGAVAFKATVVAQQPMAIVRAATVMNPVHIVEALVKGTANVAVSPITKVKNLVYKSDKADGWYGGWQRALKYAPIASRKAAGGYEMGANSVGLSSLIYKPDTKWGKTKDFVKESPLWAAGKADEITWGILWNACEAEIGKDKTFEKGSEEFYKAVASRFTDVVNQTQVVDGVLQRSQIMRSNSGWVKPLTAFKGEPTMALNAVIRAYENLRYETDSKRRGHGIRKLSRASFVFVASAILTAFARSLAVGVTGEDDEEYWDKVWKSFSGIQGDEETWFDYFKNIYLESDAVNNMNPITLIPIANEVMSIMRGYDVERLDVASVGDFVTAGQQFIDSLDEDGKYTVGYSLRKFLLKGAEFTGWSPSNLIRDIEGAIRTSRNANDDLMGVYEMEKWKTKISSNTSKYVDILYEAYSTDNEDYEAIYNDMIENGADEEKIKNGMNNRLMKDEGVNNVSELSKRWMNPKIEADFDKSIKGVKSSSAWKKADSDQRKKAEERLYEFLTSDAENVVKKREEAKKYDVDETDIVLWELAREMADDDGNNSLNAKEKKAALDMIDLGDSEIAFFYDTKTSEKAYDYGIDMKHFADFMDAIDGVKGDNKQDIIIDYADQFSEDDKEFLFFMGTQYDSYKKRRDYISYFGEEEK